MDTVVYRDKTYSVAQLKIQSGCGPTISVKLEQIDIVDLGISDAKNTTVVAVGDRYEMIFGKLTTGKDGKPESMQSCRLLSKQLLKKALPTETVSERELNARMAGNDNLVRDYQSRMQQPRRVYGR